MKVWMCWVAFRFDREQLPMCRLQPDGHGRCEWIEVPTSENAPGSAESDDDPADQPETRADPVEVDLKHLGDVTMYWHATVPTFDGGQPGMHSHDRSGLSGHSHLGGLQPHYHQSPTGVAIPMKPTA